MSDASQPSVNDRSRRVLAAAVAAIEASRVNQDPPITVEEAIDRLQSLPAVTYVIEGEGWFDCWPSYDAVLRLMTHICMGGDLRTDPELQWQSIRDPSTLPENPEQISEEVQQLVAQLKDAGTSFTFAWHVEGVPRAFAEFSGGYSPSDAYTALVNGLAEDIRFSFG